jgi:hypothetical protein
MMKGLVLSFYIDSHQDRFPSIKVQNDATKQVISNIMSMSSIQLVPHGLCILLFFLSYVIIFTALLVTQYIALTSPPSPT